MGDFIAFDYNREVHYIDSTRNIDGELIDSRQPGDRRIVLKIHYIVYPRFLSIYGKVIKYLNVTYNWIARQLFLNTKTSFTNQSFIQKRLCNSILNITNIYPYIESYIGLNNIAYLLFSLLASILFNNKYIFIGLTSFIHYIIYISTFAFKNNYKQVNMPYFIRNCLVYKTVAISNIIFLLTNLFTYQNYIYLFICCIGYCISIYSTFLLGKKLSYFGIELGRLKFTSRIDTWPYGGKFAISHPMIMGQIIGLGALCYIPNMYLGTRIILFIHIIMYIIHMFQEEIDYQTRIKS